MEVKPKLDIRDDELVLDIGSGNRPHPAADVLADRFLDESSQRAEQQPLVADRPTVLADIEALPFRDGAFDYVIASHVLEHTRDPVRACGELSRVARRGYVETPSEFWELMYGADYHTHAVSLAADGTVVFKRKSRNTPIGPVVRALGRADPLLLDLVDNHPELFYVSLRWEGRLPCRMSEHAWPEIMETEIFIERMRPRRTTRRQAVRAMARAMLPDSLRTLIRGHSRNFVVSQISRSGPDPGWPPSSKTRLKVDLESIVACPRCKHHPLEWGRTNVRCNDCGAQYERTADGLPMLLFNALGTRAAT